MTNIARRAQDHLQALSLDLCEDFGLKPQGNWLVSAEPVGFGGAEATDIGYVSRYDLSGSDDRLRPPLGV